MSTVVAASSVIAVQWGHAETAGIEEIIVTAQKRAESISDVGMSISALGGSTVESLRIREAIDVAAHTPGLTAMNAVNSGTPIFAIRGMGLDDFFQNNNSSVAIYVDGVVMSSPVFLQGMMFDVERIEVLKGPQGTLYGKNAAGGVINYITRKPTEETTGSLSFGYGNFDSYSATGVISGPLAESVRGRLAVRHQKDGHWQEDLDTGRGFGERERTGLRGHMEFDVGEDVVATISASYNDEDSVPSSSQVEGDEVAADLFGGILPGVLDLNGYPIEGLLDTGSKDPRDVRVGKLPAEKNEEGGGLGLTVKWQGARILVESITAWDKHDHFVIENIDGAPTPNFEFNAERSDAKQFYQEIRLISEPGSRFDWITGVMFSRDEIDGTVQEDFSTVSGIQVDPFQSGVFTARSDFSQKNTSYGAYINGTFEIAQGLDLVGGLRYSRDKRSFSGQATNTFGGFTFPVTSDDSSNKYSDVSYRFGIEYQPMEDLLLYANVATGYKNGVFYAGPPLNPASWSYVPTEDVFGYEAGFKRSWMDGRVALNGAYFRYEVDDRQGFLVFVTPPNLLGAGLGSIPESTSEGAELELAWRPTSRLTLNLSAANLDSEVETPPLDVRGFPLAAPIAEGSRLSMSPKWSYSGLLRYETPVGNGLSAAAQIDYTYRSGITGALGDPNAISGSRENLGASLSLTPAAGKWSATLWSRNLTDSNDEVRSITDFFGGRSIIRQMPRTYGIDVNFQLF